ncbi:MAG TPA: DUF1850 domain-containing protein [Albitalea sp.]|nr:DUF1850 domain-containing protein [Albitalea sp.]
MDVCIALAVSSALLLRLPSPVTLAWQHSVEHFALEEDWVATAQGLRLAQVRTEGLGAGVDLPDDATLSGKVWRFTPMLPLQPRVLLANSRHVAGYRVCSAGACQALGHRGEALALSACESPAR